MIVRGAFIDRDGTINIDRGYVHRIQDFEFIATALDGLQRLSENGIKIYIVTNQAGIARGFYSECDFRALTNYMLGQFAERDIKVEGVLYCPHHPDGVVEKYRQTCACRKPGTALIEAALAKETFTAAQAVMIGDKNSDIDAGLALGMTTYLVETGYGRLHAETSSAHHIVRDLATATDHILSTMSCKQQA